MKHDSYTICSNPNYKEPVDVYVNDFWSKQLASIQTTLNWIFAVLIGIFLAIIF
jgi:hypothetical protein